MTLPWHPFFWGDYSKKTLHLTQAQHGAFLLCLRYVYTTGDPIPHERRYSVTQAFTRPEQQNADFVLASFFERDADVWRSRKAEEVIALAEAKHAEKVAAGKLGGLKRAANAKRNLNQPPSTASSTASSGTERPPEAQAQANPNTTPQPVPYQEEDSSRNYQGGDADARGGPVGEADPFGEWDA